MRSVIRGKTWEGRCGFGTEEQRTRGKKEYVVDRQLWALTTRVFWRRPISFTRANIFISWQLANSNIVKTSDLSRKKISGSGKLSGSEIFDWWDYRRNRISFNFVCPFLSARESRPNSRWLPGTNLLIGIPREIPTGVPWESRREIAEIPAYAPEGNDIKELVFFAL